MLLVLSPLGSPPASLWHCQQLALQEAVLCQVFIAAYVSTFFFSLMCWFEAQPNELVSCAA